jgi:glycosyltransferase involved in cell wall biosynthesis
MIITYNHAKFIGRAIESVLAQRVDFPLAIHVVDDCSTDGTSDIVRDYAARYPGVVKPFINKKNIGRKVTQRNFHRGFSTLDGDYACILEGDDYWNSPDRLRIHVEFLEANPDFVACANSTIKIYEDGSREPHFFLPPPPKEVHDLEDAILLRSFFHPSSLTFRNVFRGRVPRYFRSPLSCDIFVTIAHAQFGKIRFFREPWSIYRAHSGGLFSNMDEVKGWMWNIDGMVACNRWTRYRHLPLFCGSIWRYCDHLLKNGTPENGFTPDLRRRYQRIRDRYRRIERWLIRADLELCKWIPGRKPKRAPTILNLGCGDRRAPDTLDVDKDPAADPDMLVDLEKTPWPWQDDFSEDIRLHYVLERLGPTFENFQLIMRELYRVSQPAARIEIEAMNPKHPSFGEDPGNLSAITPAFLRLFDAVLSAANPNSLAGPNGVDFELVHVEALLAEPYYTRWKDGLITLDEARRLAESDNRVVRATRMVLRTHKPGRIPITGRRAAPVPAPQVMEGPAGEARKAVPEVAGTAHRR